MATYDPFEAQVGWKEKLPVELLAPNKREALSKHLYQRLLDCKAMYPRRSTRDFKLKITVTESVPAPVPVDKPIIGPDGKPVLDKEGKPKFPPKSTRPPAPPIPKSAFLEIHMMETYH